MVWVAFIALLGLGAAPTTAQDIGHLGTNRLDFETVKAESSQEAMGKGIVEYRGGDEPSSQWRASFRFGDLDPKTAYTVVIRGRFGELGSRDADAFAPLCSFETDSDGKGSCFWYFRGLARLNVAQLRVGDEDGDRVLQASRSGGPGSISTDANRFSPGGEISSRKAEPGGKASN